MNPPAKPWLLFAGSCSFAVALLHFGMIIAGPPAYRFFGAGEGFAQMAASGSILPAMVTFIFALIFAVWGLYAFSGAGVIRPLPLLRLGLIVIASIYTLRGIVIIFQIFLLVVSPHSVSFNDMIFSLVSLVIGAAYFVGLLSARQGRKGDASPAATEPRDGLG